jgi:glycosyltransferase involved in cell wall biosynthesis
MHILILPSWYPGITGREGLFIQEQALALAKYSGHQITILNWGPNEFVLKLRNPLASIKVLLSFPFRHCEIIRHADNIVEYKVPQLTWTSRLFMGNYNVVADALTKALSRVEQDRGKVSLIHAHVAFPAGFLARYLAKKLSVPYIITEHSGPFPFKEYETGQDISALITEPLRQAGAVIAVSNWLAGCITTKTGCRVAVIPNSVDTTFFKPTEQQISRPVRRRLFCLSHLTEQKGIGDLLQAVRIIAGNGLEFSLRIGGTGHQQKRFMKLASISGLAERIEWLGALNRTEALREYQACDFLVMPSRLETLSMVILEALACGKPVLATDCGGPADLINPENGLLVRPGNSLELAEAIELMLQNHANYSADLIRTKCLKNFSPEVIVNRINTVYQSITNH